MQNSVRRFLAIAFLFVFAAPTRAQKVQFSADMQLRNGSGSTQTVKLFVGDMRARLDRASTESETGGIGSLIIDFQNQFIFLLIPSSKTYLQVEGSVGTSFYQGAWMFRPGTPKYPCNAWVREADQRGISLRCQAAGQDTVNGRVTQKWDATTSSDDRGHGTLWYDPDLNFIVKVLRVSKNGIESGYEIQNVNAGTQPPSLFEVPNTYRKFTLPKLFDVLTGIGEW